jgi:hypothetical protein
MRDDDADLLESTATSGAAAETAATPEAKAGRILDRRLDRAQRFLPAVLAEWLEHLRRPSASWARVPLGVLLILGGLLSFLPFLGVWMLPLGLVLLSLDVVLLRRPTARMLVSGERLWARFRRRRREE